VIRSFRRAVLGSVALTVALVVAPSCGGGLVEAPGATLTVFAAASLTEAFTTIGSDFESAHPGVRVVLSFGPSDGLAGQIREGAPADVFASASPKWMDDVAANGPGITDRADFAGNSLVVILPVGNPGGVSSVQDLARPGLKLVLAAPGVPAGDYARQVLEHARIAGSAEANVVSNEEDVKGVVQKVALGEADAGIVYRTDVTSAVSPEVRVVDIPPGLNVLAVYPIAAVGGSPHQELAESFVAYVLGPGQSALGALGFLPADAASG